MYTPPSKPVIAPKAPITDLPCATNPTGPQPSKPAPVYRPPGTAPTPPVASNPAPYVPPSVAPSQGTGSNNPAPTAASLNSQLSEATLTISKASQALGFTGPARDFLAFAQNLAVELKTLRAKK